MSRRGDRLVFGSGARVGGHRNGRGGRESLRKWLQKLSNASMQCNANPDFIGLVTVMALSLVCWGSTGGVKGHASKTLPELRAWGTPTLFKHNETPSVHVYCLA